MEAQKTIVNRAASYHSTDSLVTENHEETEGTRVAFTANYHAQSLHKQPVGLAMS